MSKSDVVDGSSTGTWAPRMWALSRLSLGRYWHETDMAALVGHVRYRGWNGSRVSGSAGPLLSR